MSKQRVSPFINYCGIEVVSMLEGEAELKMPIIDDLKNSGGITHGGALATLADSAAGAASWTVVEEHQMAVTTDFNLTCLKSSVEGDIVAKAKMVHTGRRFMRAEVSLLCGEDLLARAGVSFMVVDRPNYKE